jgi:Fe2+ transport system protein FeoA
LDEARLGQAVTVEQVGGERAFRRRMMELGLVPGTRATVLRIAPLGDPIELEMRGCNLSIRHAEARCILVAPLTPAAEPA